MQYRRLGKLDIQVSVLGFGCMRLTTRDGLPMSAEPNSLNRQGLPTAVELRPDRPTLVNYIQGVARIPPDFKMVKDVEFGKDELTFVSVTGKRITVPVRFEFARTGNL